MIPCNKSPREQEGSRRKCIYIYSRLGFVDSTKSIYDYHRTKETGNISMKIDTYLAQVEETNKVKDSKDGYKVLALGLVGEIGSLFSEIKKSIDISALSK